MGVHYVVDREDGARISKGIEVIRAMKTLKYIDGSSPKEFWKKHDARAVPGTRGAPAKSGTH